MTSPTRSTGKAYVELHGDYSKLGPEAEKEIQRAINKAANKLDFDDLAKEAELAGEQAGRRFGNEFTDEAADGVKKSRGKFKTAGKDAGDAFRDGFGGLDLSTTVGGIAAALVPGGGGHGIADELEEGFENIAETLEEVLATSVDLLGLLQSGFSSIFAGRGEQIAEFFSAQMERIKHLWATLREQGREVLGRLFDEDSREWFNRLITRGRDWFNDMRTRGRAFFTDLLNRSRPFFRNLIDRGRTFFRDWGDRHGGSFFGRLLTRGRGFFSRLGSQAASFATRLGAQVGSALQSAFQSASASLQQAFSQIGSAISSIGGGLGALLPLAGMAALIPVLVLVAGALVQLSAALLALPAAIGVALVAIAPLVIALSGVSEAVSAGFSGDVEKFNEALKKLAPSAQKVVKELVALKPQFDSIKRNVQDAFFAPLVGAFTTLGKTLLPLVNRGFTQVASSLGFLVRGVLDLLSTKENLSTFAALFATTNRVIQTLEPTIANLAQALLNLFKPALPFIERGATAFRDFSATVEGFTRRIAGDGSLTGWLEKAAGIFNSLLKIGREFGSYLLTLLGGKIGDNGAGFLKDLGDEIERINEFLKTREGQDFINNLATGFKAVGKIITFLISLFPIMVSVINGTVEGIRFLGRVLEAIGRGAVVTVLAIGKFFQWLGTTIADAFVVAYNSVIDFFKDVGSAIGNFFTETIPGWFRSVVSFFRGLPDQLSEGISDLGARLKKGIADAWNFVFTETFRQVGRVIGIILALPYLIGVAVDKIPEILANVWNSIWSTAVETWDAISSTVTDAVNAIPELLTAAGEAITGFFDSLWDGIVAAAMAVPGLLADAGRAISSFFVDLWNGVVTDSYNAVVGGFNNLMNFFGTLPGRVAALGPKLYNAAVGLGRKIGEGLSNIGNFASEIGGKIVGTIRGGVNRIIDSINRGIADIDDKLPVSLPRIPHLAKGAMINSPTLALVGEAGPEVVVPLSDPRRAQQLANESGLTEMLRGSKGSPNVYVTVYLDPTGAIIPITRTVVNDALDEQGTELGYGVRGD